MRTAARESFCPFGTFDFHACWLRTISERQQKWLALKLSFPRPPSRVLPRAFIGARFSPEPSAQSVSLVSLGPGLGLATVSPWTPSATPPATFGIAAGIWLIITQWLSAGLGGYLAGRLREKWVGVRTDEVLFRDTAHGLLAWALATIIVVALLIVGSAVAGAAAAAAPTPAAPVSPEAAEAARKAAISFSFFSSLSFLIGAFIGAVAGALGGYHRDEI
jgi:hypothetical protein